MLSDLVAWSGTVGFVPVSMHLLVLSAFRPGVVKFSRPPRTISFQCTFWCSVLSDSSDGEPDGTPIGFNAPFGAQCFPTRGLSMCGFSLLVSMHLLVLSAFRQKMLKNTLVGMKFQCTFWCSVLSDLKQALAEKAALKVSMHLLVLSAFRPSSRSRASAAFAFQCTFWCSVLSDAERRGRRRRKHGFNAPFGAQCFPTEWSDPRSYDVVFQCTFWCSVLSDGLPAGQS